MSHKRNISWVLFPLLSVSTTIIPLTSCGSDGSVNDIGGFDHDFGFDVMTYNRLEKQFQDLYWSKLISENETLTDDVVNEKYKNFCNVDILNLRNYLFDQSKNYSYTTRTNTLINYASQQYDIDLVRASNVSDSDFESLKKSSLESLEIYMSNLNLDDEYKKTCVEKFSHSFDKILVDCTKHSSDMSTILLELKSRIIECYSSINDDCALVATYSVLKRFTDNYKFSVKKPLESDYLWDKLIGKAKEGDFIVGDPIEIIPGEKVNLPIKKDFIDKIFDIEPTNNKNNSTSLDHGDIHFAHDMIAGYTLTPILISMNEDIYSNEYTFNIDWQLIDNTYINQDQQKQKNVTAHTILDENGNIEAMDKFSIDDIDNINEYQFPQYELSASGEYQKNNLDKAYFTNENNLINFTWDSVNKPALEDFLPSTITFDKDKKLINDNVNYEQQMLENNLADSGLKVNNINLSTLIKQENKNRKEQLNVVFDALTSGEQPTIKDDNDLSIEEKFVKYCVVNSNNDVQLQMNANTNTIKSEFVVGYKNTQENYSLTDKFVNENLILSNNFAAKAVKSYHDVVDYVNIQLDSTALTSLLILSRLILLGFLIAITYIILIIASNSTSFNLKGKMVSSVQKNLLYIIVSMLMIALYTWVIGVAVPLEKEHDNISKWNNSISSGTSKLNICTNIVNDKKYCDNEQNFVTYAKNNFGDSYKLYWYYSHFVNAINDKDNNVDGCSANKASKDFKEFIDLRNSFQATLHKSAITWLATITILIALVVSIIATVTIYKQLSPDKKDVNNLNFDSVADSVYNSNKKMVEIYNDGKQNIIDRMNTIYTDFINVNN